VLACVCSSLILETRDKQQKDEERKKFTAPSHKNIFFPLNEKRENEGRGKRK